MALASVVAQMILNALKMTLLVYAYAVGLAYLWTPR